MKPPTATPSPACRRISALRPSGFHRAAATARPTGQAVTERDAVDAMLVPADLLGGDESIILAIKPSLWFIAFDSATWAVVMLCMVACASWLAETIAISEARFMSAVLALLGLRVVVAVLRWVARSYVLTNRRIMRLRGVLRPDVFECPLVNIRNTTVSTSFPEALTGLGTINFIITTPENRLGVWRNVSDPQRVHAEIRKAIERAIDSQPHI